MIEDVSQDKSVCEDSQIISLVDRTVKLVWKENIQQDVSHGFVLYEDTLKSALYYHLRKKLNAVLKEKKLCIFTEFNTGPLAGKGVRADMAIVQIDDDNGEKHLRHRIAKVYSLIELKYVNKYTSVEKLGHDVEKVLGLMKGKEFSGCQFYLGFIHEGEFDAKEKSWLYKWQQVRAAGKLTELSACYYTNREDMRYTVVSYNGMNEDLNDAFE